MHYRALALLFQEFHDDRGHSFSPGNQEQMPVIDDVQLGVGNPPGPVSYTHLTLPTNREV